MLFRSPCLLFGLYFEIQVGGEMGRRPKPLKLAVLDGTYRLDRNKLSPTAGGKLAKPAELGRYGSKLWDQVLPHAESVGGGECDSESLAGMCRWYNDYRRIQAALVKVSPTNDKYRGLLYSMATAWRAFVDMAGRFGLTPVDRAKLRVDPKEEKDETEERFFG